MADPTPEEDIQDVSDRLVHLHASIDMVLERVGQPMVAEGVRRELRRIGDDMLEQHAILEAVLARIRARQES